jgi:hypothetical protein
MPQIGSYHGLASAHEGYGQRAEEPISGRTTERGLVSQVAVK